VYECTRLQVSCPKGHFFPKWSCADYESEAKPNPNPNPNSNRNPNPMPIMFLTNDPSDK